MLIRLLEMEEWGRYDELLKQLVLEHEYFINDFSHMNQELSTIFVLEKEDQFIGFVRIDCFDAERIQHVGRVSIGILKDFQGQGHGKKLLAQAVTWAKEFGLRRLETTIVTRNRPALWLFSQVGFSVEGTRRKSFKLEEQLMDEFYLSHLILNYK